MAKVVSLYIDDSSLRLMVTQGKQIRVWAESLLEPGLIENNMVMNEAEIVSRIKRLFQMQKLRPGKVLVGISGLRCLTRPIFLPRLPREMLDEAIRREAQRVLPVAVEELHISWQTLPAPAEQTHAFMVGIPRRTADSLLGALQLAGLKPNFMQIKPLLVAKLAGNTTAILVDIQPTDFDIVIVIDGIPQPIRSVRFATEGSSIEEKLRIMRSELNRTLAFHNANSPEKALGENVPIFVSGDTIDEATFFKQLSDEVGHPVLALPSPLQARPGMDQSHYMANIGLTVDAATPSENTGTAIVSLNALPAQYQVKPISLPNILALPSAVVAVGLIIFLLILIRNASAEITSANTQLANTDKLLQQRQTQRKELLDNVAQLENRVNTMTSLTEGFTAAIGMLEEQGKAVNADLAAALNNLPQGISLNTISHVASILTITGNSSSERPILVYVTNLDETGRFTDITITEMVRNGDASIEFTLVGALQIQGIGASSLEVALGSLPVAVSLTSVDTSQGVLIVNGAAPNADKIFAYLRALEASGRFEEITIISMTRTDDGKMRFSIEIKTGE